MWTDLFKAKEAWWHVGICKRVAVLTAHGNDYLDQKKVHANLSI